MVVQPIWKKCSSNWIISPSRGENKIIFETTAKLETTAKYSMSSFPCILWTAHWNGQEFPYTERCLEHSSQKSASRPKLEVGGISKFPALWISHEKTAVKESHEFPEKLVVGRRILSFLGRFCLFWGAFAVSFEGGYTLPKFNIAPEKLPSQ